MLTSAEGRGYHETAGNRDDSSDIGTLGRLYESRRPVAVGFGWSDIRQARNVITAVNSLRSRAAVGLEIRRVAAPTLAGQRPICLNTLFIWVWRSRFTV